jgi:hypothetical protein
MQLILCASTKERGHLREGLSVQRLEIDVTGIMKSEMSQAY